MIRTVTGAVLGDVVQTENRLNRRTQQEVERFCFEDFAKRYPMPLGTPQFGDKPDVICVGARTLGIEIAELYLSDGSDDSSEQVQRHRQAAVVKRAQREYLMQGGKRFELHVEFDPRHPIKEVRPVAETLAARSGSLEVLSTQYLRGTPFKDLPEVSAIYLNRREYGDARWLVGGGRYVPRLATDRMEHLVRDKERKLAGYTACDEYWLLLVVDWMDGAQDQDIQWPTGASPVETVFGKVIVFRPGWDEYTDVPLVRPDTSLSM